MNETRWGLAVAVGALAVAGATWFLLRQEPAAEAPVDAAAEPASAAPLHYPVPDAEALPASPPLPALADSDSVFKEALAQLLGAAPVAAFLIPDNLIRRFVVSVDNLTRERLPLQFRPLRNVAGRFSVRSEGETLTLNEDNSARYTPMIEVLKALDSAQLAQVYFRYYPLFQKAYQEIGYPDRYFNDRVIEVIDHLLAAPEPAGPITLLRPKVYYEFADPKLEALSAGQKTMIRMGAQNEAAVKAKLRELRPLLAARQRAD